MSSSNSFGKIFRWTSFGESHGEAMGVVIDGCPANVPVSAEAIQVQLDRRRPGQQDAVAKEVLVSARDEADRVEILSGVFDGRTLGTPILCMVKNKDQRTEDYDKIKKEARVGHADDVWLQKFGHTDHRGGGRASGRETLCRVIAGSVAAQFLQRKDPALRVHSFVKSIGTHELNSDELASIEKLVKENNFSADSFTVRFPKTGIDIASVLKQAKEKGESYGGVVETWVDNCPAGLGEPVFHKLKSDLASAMMSIGATCGFELGGGFAMSRDKGTEVHTSAQSKVYGGIRGGITTGERIIFRVAFKPTSSIKDTAKAGRHDPCIVPRAVPVVEAMTWAVLADHELMNRASRL